MRAIDVLKRFFLIYLSFLLSLLIVTIPVYGLFLSMYADKTTESSQAALQTGLEDIEKDLNQITTSLLHQLDESSLRSVISARTIPPTQYSVLNEAAKQFNRMILYQGSSTDSGLLLASGVIISQNRVYLSGSEMYPRFFRCEEYDSYDDWYSALSSVVQNSYAFLPMTVVHSDDTVYRAIPFVLRPVSEYGGMPARRTIFFHMVSEDYLRRRLVPPGLTDDCALRIYSGSTLLYASNYSETEQYVTLSSIGARYSLRVEMGVRKDLFNEMLAPLRSFIILAALLFIVISLLMAVFFAWRSARPVVSLVHKADSIKENESMPSAAHYKDAYAYIADFLSHVDTTFGDYKSMLDHQSDLLRSMLFGQLIHGQIINPAEHPTLRQHLASFPERYVVVLCRTCDAAPEAEELSRRQVIWMSLLRMRLPQNSIVFTANLSNVAIVPCIADSWREELAPILEEISQEMLRLSGHESIIIVSQPFEGIDRLSEAYHQVHALRRVHGLTYQQLLFCAPVAEAPEVSPASIDFSRYCKLITRMDREGAEAMIADTIARLQSSSFTSEHNILCLFHGYACQLIHVQSEMAMAGTADVRIPEYDAQMPLDQLFGQLITCANEMIERMEKRAYEMRDSQEQAVLSYIQEHLDDPDLYSRSIADAFSLSEHTLQRLMHRAAGCTFFEYLEKIRMNRAQELVTKSDLLLSDVMLRCGYSSRNTFYKAFKRSFGISPSEMRQSSQK